MSNEFNLLELLDHQKMRPLKFDGLALCPEYGLHVGIEPVRGSSHVPGGHQWHYCCCPDPETAASNAL